MKRFVSAVCLCVFLLVSGLFIFLPASGAQSSVLESLLNLPAPPPPNPLVESRLRDAQFYSKNNPPRDDAPVDDLMTYWQMQNQVNPKYNYAVEPTDKTLDRILSELEKNPAELTSYLNVLSLKPSAADFVKRLYDSEMSRQELGEEWREVVKTWLTYNSSFFSDELLELAAEAAETGEYVTNQNEVLALARVDWDKARPLLERMYNSTDAPILQTLARWAFYERALREGDIGDTDKYRKELQETVENKSAKPGNRDLAMDAIVEAGDFPGRDDWYFSLLEDETLLDLRVNGASYTSLTTLLNHSPSDKYTEKMLELIKSNNQAVRNAAARNLGTLLDEKNPEVIRALLPWLENPNWAKEVAGERTTLVRVLAEFQIPESVPGLILILNESEKREIPNYSNSNVAVATNSSVYANSNSTVQTISSEVVYRYRISAVAALARQKDARAAAALRGILPQVDEYQRANVVYALLVSNGFSVPEQIEALELAAKSLPQVTTVLTNTMPYSTNATYPTEAPISPPALMTVPSMNMANVTRTEVFTVANRTYGNTSAVYNPNDIRAILGQQIINNPEPSGEFVSALIDRIGVLENGKDRALASTLRNIMLNWRGAAINSLFLRDLKNGKADTDTILRLLTVRKELKAKQTGEIYEIRTGSPTAVGISACLLEDINEYGAILSGENVESKIAMLGCARLIRAQLPVQKVAENLQSPNKLLALAAELYLESEDSPEARQIVLSRHPDEAKILGARTSFASEDSTGGGSRLAELFATVNESYPFANYYYIDSYYEELEATEKLLQEEVKENAELLGVYAYDGNFVRIYKDKAVFSRTENAARYRERTLNKEEFDNLKYYLASQRVDELPPFLSACVDCKERELLMLGRGGGRRVFVKAERMPQFFAQLDDMFAEMRRQPGKLRYGLEKSVTGLEILFADDILQARAVWKTGDDFRVLLEDTERRKRIDKELELQDAADEEKEDVDYENLEKMSQKRREQRKYENFSWFKFERGKPGDFANQPPQIEYFPKLDSFSAAPKIGQWKASAGKLEIRADDEGLYKINNGAFSKIRTGYYDKPVITPNGRWAIVTKYDEEGNMTPVRVNLLTNKEFKLAMPEHSLIEAVVFVPSLNKVLLYAGSYYEEEYEERPQSDGNYFLLDADTGVVQQVKGEVQPLLQQTFRPLQAASAADEFWAAISDSEENETQLGVYNAKTLSFKPLLKIPQIKFDSMNMWVDAGRVYFVYEGHLLSLPLPKT